MQRIIPSVAALLVLATAASAQTVSRSYTTTDIYGNISTTTISGPASVAGIIAGQDVYGGFPNYANGIPSYDNSNYPPQNYGDYAGNYGGYAGYNYPQQAPYPYAYPPQTYYIPSQTFYLPHPTVGHFAPPSFTSIPQIITTPGVPYYPNGGYSCPAPSYGYGVGSRTTITSGTASIARGSVNVSIGAASIQRR